MGLLEVLVAGAIMMITVMAMFGGVNYMMRSQKNVSQLTSFDALVGGISRILSSTIQCPAAFKDAASSTVVLDVPFGGANVPVPEISIGSTILARDGQPLGSGLVIEQLRFNSPVSSTTVACATGTCNQVTSVLFLQAAVTIDGGGGGTTVRRQRWFTTLLTNTATNRIVECSGVPGTQAAPTGTGTAGRVPMWVNSTGLLGDSAIHQLGSGGNPQFGIGTVTPGAFVTSPRLHVATDGAREVALEGASAVVPGPSLQGYRARGTVAAKVMVQAGDELMKLMGLGWDGTNYQTSGRISFVVDGTPGANDMPTAIFFRVAPDGSNALTNAAMVIRANGNVGIGNDNPAYKLDITGRLNAANLRVGGVVVCTPAGCTPASDARLKQNVEPLEDSLSKILKLRGVSFDWIDRSKFGKARQIGLLAQEVRQVFPEAVVEDRRDGLLRMGYDRLIAPLIESVKAMHGIGSKSDARLEAIEAEREAVRRRIEQLERRVGARGAL